MDLLGRRTELLAPPGDHRVHDHSRVFNRPDECRKFRQLWWWILFHFNLFFVSVYVSQRHPMFIQFHDGCSGNTRPRQSSSMCSPPVHLPLGGFRFHLRVDIFEVKAAKNSCTAKRKQTEKFYCFRLPIIVKSTLIILMGTAYSLFIEISHANIFDCYDNRVT